VNFTGVKLTTSLNNTVFVCSSISAEPFRAQDHLSELKISSAMKGKLLFADAEEVRRCRDDGLSWKIIAKNLGTNVNTLREWRKINQFDVSAAISRQ
jgi:hypothetical protein